MIVTAYRHAPLIGYRRFDWFKRNLGCWLRLLQRSAVFLLSPNRLISPVIVFNSRITSHIKNLGVVYYLNYRTTNYLMFYSVIHINNSMVNYGANTTNISFKGLRD